MMTHSLPKPLIFGATVAPFALPALVHHGWSWTNVGNVGLVGIIV